MDAFELWCWRRLSKVPWIARRSNQSILKEISPEYSLEGVMLKLKLQYFGHLMRRTDSLGKTLMLGKIEDKRRRGATEDEIAGWHHWLDGRESKWTPGVDDGQGGLECCDSWGRKESDTTEWLIWFDLIWSDGFSSSHVWMWELNYKKGWVLKNWCFPIVVLEKILESPLDSKEIKPVNPKRNQLWKFTGKTGAEAEAPIFCPPEKNSWLWKIPWCWEKLRARGKRGNRGWDVWMASLT